jgi:hypothetical protein
MGLVPTTGGYLNVDVLREAQVFGVFAIGHIRLWRMIHSEASGISGCQMLCFGMRF